MKEIEAIIHGIQQETDFECKKILKEAKEKILKQKKESEDLIKKKVRSMIRKYDARTNLILKKGELFVKDFERKEILKIKNELVNDLIKKAKAYIIGQNTEDYFLFILHLMRKFKLDKKGEVFFSSEDLKRMPKNFEAEVSKISGNKLKISKESKNIDHGFILVYSRIEENCSINAIFTDNYDEIRDTVSKILFKA